MNIAKPNSIGEKKLIAETFELARQINSLAFEGRVTLTRTRIKDGFVFIPLGNTGYYLRVGRNTIHKTQGIALGNDQLFVVGRDDLEMINNILASLVDRV